MLWMSSSVFSLISTSNNPSGFAPQPLSRPLATLDPTHMYYRSELTGEANFEAEGYGHYPAFMMIPSEWLWAQESYISPLDQFSVLEDWATAVQAYHSEDIVHGNLTPDSVGVVHGTGILIKARHLHSPKRWLEKPLYDDDIFGARWAATELFRIGEADPRPTKMSDVYSFACLMLQMLTGNEPYCGTRRPEQIVYLKHLGREPIDAQTPKVADRYVTFMRWCWSPEPEKRPTMQTVVDFIHKEIVRLSSE